MAPATLPSSLEGVNGRHDNERFQPSIIVVPDGATTELPNPRAALRVNERDPSEGPAQSEIRHGSAENIPGAVCIQPFPIIGLRHFEALDRLQ